MLVKNTNLLKHFNIPLSEIRHHRLFFYALFLTFQFISYSLLGPLSIKYSLNLWSPQTFLDSYIPFWPFMVIPYLLYSPLLTAPLFLNLKKQTLNRTAGQLLSASLINYLCSFIISFSPSIRTALPEVDNLFLFLIERIYTTDTDSMFFPSMHVMHPLLISLNLWKAKNNFKWAALIGTLGLTVSTVFIKQHFLLDIVFGLISAFIIHYISSRFLFSNSVKSSP